MRNLFIVFASLWLVGCSSTRLVNEWQNPETKIYEANKVLVIGLSADDAIRRDYETALVAALEDEDVIAVRSIDFFEKSFQDERKSEEEMDDIENTLLDAGFDTVMYSKITSSEDKVSFVKSLWEMEGEFANFKNYYIHSQDDIYKSGEREVYKIYHTETSLFCICPGKERELLWQGNIDITAPRAPEKNIKEYVKVLMKTFRKNQLVFLK